MVREEYSAVGARGGGGGGGGVSATILLRWFDAGQPMANSLQGVRGNYQRQSGWFLLFSPLQKNKNCVPGTNISAGK